jgi:hypothetical protein
MNVCKRILAGLTLLLATVMLLLSLAGGVGVWIVKEPATDKATHVFERIEAALKVADEGLGQVKTSLDRAAERLDSDKKEQRKLAQKPQEGGAIRRLMLRTVQQVAPELGNANEKLHTVAEAAVVVNSILEDVGSFPFLSISGLDLDRLTEMNSRLADVGPAAWELSRLLGEPAPGDSDTATNTRLSTVERTLKTMQGFVAEYHPRVTEVRQRTEGLKSRIFFWITPASVLVSLICFWIALSQISVLFHAWSWWKH